ncbi:MAG: DUF3592 domain-containing protein [Calditrichaeota bacterium]|nr:MAG: DUF3592 domain-containing protein [Calditrichota bacterium]
METTFTLATPPRKIPLLVKSKIFFGGLLNQIGWAVFLFGILICWAFSVDGVFKSMYYFSGTLDHAEGLVVKVSESSASEGDVEVMQMDYLFESAGREYNGRSYFTGEFYEVGAKVDVEFSFTNPEYSRISGLRYSLFGAGILFILIFPLIGFLIILAGILRARKTIFLLKNGKPALGTLIKKGISNITVNEVPLERLTFEFTTETMKRIKITEDTANPQKLEDEAQERLLYNPENPQHAKLIDSLPGDAVLNSSGKFERDKDANLLMNIVVLVIPVVTLYVVYTWLF